MNTSFNSATCEVVCYIINPICLGCFLAYFAGMCAYVHMADVTAGRCADLHNCVQYCTVPVHSLHSLCTYAHMPAKQALDISVRPETVQMCTYAGNARQYM